MKTELPHNIAPLWIIVALVVLLGMIEVSIEGTAGEVLRWSGLALIVVTAVVAGLRSGGGRR